MKFVLIGEQGTGKTTFRKTFCELHGMKPMMDVKGYDFSVYENEQAKLQVYDLVAGEQHSNRYLNKIIGGSDTIIIFYSIIRKYQSIAEQIDPWYELLVERYEESIEYPPLLVLLGSHLDLHSENTIPAPDLQRWKNVLGHVSHYQINCYDRSSIISIIEEVLPGLLW